MKLRYTGPFTVTFHTAGVGEVEPGAEFTVPDGIADAFLRRADFEEVFEPVESPVKVGRKKAAPVSEPLIEPSDAVSAEDTTTL